MKPPLKFSLGGAVDLNTDENLEGNLTMTLLPWDY
jgi:hypothetical protein